MEWFFEPGHTAAEFCVRHMMVTYVRGHFKNIEGKLRYDPDHPEKTSVSVTIDARNLWTGDPDRDAHLRSPDFLDVEKYPEIKFTGKTELNRHDFGVDWSSPLTRNGLVVGKIVQITIDAEAVLLTP